MRNIAPYIFVVLLLYTLEVHGNFETGFTNASCSTMEPPGMNGKQNSTSPYNVTLSADVYTINGTIMVNITGGDYQGFMLQARKVGTSTIVGTFSSAVNKTKLIKCTADSDTLSHSSSMVKNVNNTYKWMAPSMDVGKVVFVATVFQNKTMYWPNLMSSPIMLNGTTDNSTRAGTNGTMTGNSTMAKNTTGTVNMTTQAPNSSAAAASSNSTGSSLTKKMNTDVWSLFIVIHCTMILANYFMGG